MGFVDHGVCTLNRRAVPVIADWLPGAGDMAAGGAGEVTDGVGDIFRFGDTAGRG